MAQQGVHLDREKFCCSICLDLLKDPVTIPCGHSYCRTCIRNHWNGDDQRRVYSCPQCRQTFTPRPVLGKNTMLADLVEELKKTGLQAAPHPHCYAGAEDVACDVCTGRKLKAFKSCLVCVASYCETHLQPHFESPPLKRHKLVEPCKTLQETLCPCHDEVMKIFCRTDQQLICYLCSMDEHEGHDTVSAAAERTERQRELEVSRLSIQQKIQTREEDLKLLQQEMEAINRSADRAEWDVQRIFAQLIRFMEKKCSEVKQQLRSQQETEVSRVKELQEKLEQEITELRKLSHMEYPTKFLHSYSSLSQLSAYRDSPSIQTCPLRYFEDVSPAVSKLIDQLQDALKDKWTKVLRSILKVDVLLPCAEPETRAEFLQYSCELTLDPNTTGLILSEGNRKVSYGSGSQPYHPDRFIQRSQVLSKESMTGRCYWEVEVNDFVSVAVAYKDISRRRAESEFGYNNVSWAINCHKKHVNPLTRVGVYLDHRAGLLSFYGISETMTLLQRVQTTFTKPLYAGFRISVGSAELCQLQ